MQWEGRAPGAGRAGAGWSWGARPRAAAGRPPRTRLGNRKPARTPRAGASLHLGTPPAVPPPQRPACGSLTSREPRAEPCGGAGARHGRGWLRPRPPAPRHAVLGAACRARRGEGTKMAAAGPGAGERGDPRAPGSRRRAGSGPGRSLPVGKRQAGDGRSDGPAQSLHLGAELLSFGACHGSLAF